MKNKEIDLDNMHISFVNLSYRTDRLEHITKQLEKAGIKAQRFNALKTSEHQWDENIWGTMLRRTPGACGCYQSQMEVLKKGLELNKTTMVLEDDVQFCSDFKERIEYINKFLEGKDWAIAWLGATFHVNVPHWHNGSNGMIENRNLYRDAEQTEDARIFRTFGTFCTYSYVVNIDYIPKVLEMLEQRKPTSIGIDFSMIEMQPDIPTFAMVPGSCRQIDNRSDIGNGDTIFSGFSRLNGNEENSRYWFQENMNDFDPNTFDWAEATKK